MEVATLVTGFIGGVGEPAVKGKKKEKSEKKFKINTNKHTPSFLSLVLPPLQTHINTSGRVGGVMSKYSIKKRIAASVLMRMYIMRCIPSFSTMTRVLLLIPAR